MLNKDPLSRINIKHILDHSFVKSVSSKLGLTPINVHEGNKMKKGVPLYLSQALNKIVTKEVVGLKVQTKKREAFEP